MFSMKIHTMPLLVLLSKGLGIMQGVHPCIDIITYFNYLKLPFIFVLVVLQTIEKMGALIKGHEKEIIIYLKENYCLACGLDLWKDDNKMSEKQC